MSEERFSSLESKMDDIANSLKSLSRSVKEISRKVDHHNQGIEGDPTHGWPSYAERLNDLESQLKNLTEFKKKITYLATVIATAVSGLITAAAWILNRIF